MQGMQWGLPQVPAPQGQRRPVLAGFMWVFLFVMLCLPFVSNGGFAAIWIPLFCMLLAVLFMWLPFEPVGALLGAKHAGLTPVRAVLGPLMVRSTSSGWRGRRTWASYPALCQIALEETAVERLRSGVPSILLGHLIGSIARWLAIVIGGYLVLGIGVGIVGIIVFTPLAMFCMALGWNVMLPAMNDLQALRAGSPEGDRILASWAVINASAGGVRPRDWNPTWVGLLVENPLGNAHDLLPFQQAYFYALDSGNIADAEKYLNHALSIFETDRVLWGRTYCLDSAFFAARYRHDAIEARRWLDLRNTVTLDRHSAKRISAAVLLTEGRLAESMTAIHDGLASAEQSFDPGIASMDADLLRAMLAEINDANASARVPVSSLIDA